MATVTLTIPDAATMTRIVNAMCAAGGYTGDPTDSTAKAAFAKQMLIAYVRNIVVGVEMAAQTTQPPTITPPVLS